MVTIVKQMDCRIIDASFTLGFCIHRRKYTKLYGWTIEAETSHGASLFLPVTILPGLTVLQFLDKTTRRPSASKTCFVQDSRYSQCISVQDGFQAL
jgi:hypothetical protein